MCVCVCVCVCVMDIASYLGGSGQDVGVAKTLYTIYDINQYWMGPKLDQPDPLLYPCVYQPQIVLSRRLLGSCGVMWHAIFCQSFFVTN